MDCCWRRLRKSTRSTKPVRKQHKRARRYRQWEEDVLNAAMAKCGTEVAVPGIQVTVRGGSSSSTDPREPAQSMSWAMRPGDQLILKMKLRTPEGKRRGAVNARTRLKGRANVEVSDMVIHMDMKKANIKRCEMYQGLDEKKCVSLTTEGREACERVAIKALRLR